MRGSILFLVVCAQHYSSTNNVLNQNSGMIYHYVTGSIRITCRYSTRYNGFGGLSLCTIAYFQAVLRMGKNFIPSKIRCLSFQYKLVSCTCMSCDPDIKLEFTRFISTNVLLSLVRVFSLVFSKKVGTLPFKMYILCTITFCIDCLSWNRCIN